MKNIRRLTIAIICLIGILLLPPNSETHAYSPYYYGVSEFSEGLAKIQKNGWIWGYMNTKGKLAIGFKYGNAENFSEGLAAVSQQKQTNGGYAAPKPKWGFIDKKGNLKIKYNFNYASSFKDGLALVRNSKDLYGYINKSGKYVINPIFSQGYDFSDGLALVQNKDAQYGYIDKKGKYVIKPQFFTALSFKEGIAYVCKDQYCGYINTKGEFLLRFAMGSSLYLSEFRENFSVFRIEEVRGYIDKTKIPMTFIETPQFTEMEYFHEGLARVKYNGKWGFVDKKMNFVIQPKYDSLNMGTVFSEGLIQAKVNGKWGYMDKKGKMIIKAQFDVAYSFREGYAIIVKNKKYGFVDKKGKVVMFK